MICFFGSTCVPAIVMINKLHSKVGSIVGLRSGYGESDISLMLYNPILYRSASFTSVSFAAFRGNSVNHAILFSIVNSVFRPYLMTITTTKIKHFTPYQNHTNSFVCEFDTLDCADGVNENDGRDFPFGKGSGTAAFTSGIGLTT